MATYKDIGVELSGHVGLIEIRRPPNNFFDNSLINQIGMALEAFDADAKCRSVVLAAEGKNFCAGADFASRGANPDATTNNPGAKHLYKEATRLFRAKKPIVAAVQGAARQPSFGERQGAASRRWISPGSSSSEIRVCSSESRSRRVTVPSSIVWWSTVTPHGVPISSCRR